MPNYKRVFANGYSYFLTVVTYQRNPILIKNIDLLKKSFEYSKTKYQYKLEAVVILPEHFHIIITPNIATEYPKIIQSIKYYFSKHCNPKYYNHITQSTSRTKENYKPIWQKRYYEHTIRDENDLKIRLNYIHYNPIKHNMVTNVKDWRYSSFEKYVNSGYYEINWGNFDINIDFE